MRILPNQRILSALRCPICQSRIELSEENAQGGRSLFCGGQRRHCFDISASGYVNFMAPGRTAGGDSKQAVRARTDFLNLELYRPVADALCRTVRRYIPVEDAVAVDAGCGEGYYTSLLAQSGFSCVGFDLSRFAVDAAAKRTGKAGVQVGFFGVSSVFEMPIKNDSAAAVVNVFAPCAEEEYCRVLMPGGILAVAYAGPEHLMGLKRAVYSQTRENDGRADLPKRMKCVEEVRVRFDIEVKGTENVMNLFAMTPYYWKTSVSDMEKLKSLESLTTAVDVILAIYQKEDTAADGQKKEDDGCRSH
ncbi:MAG: methyltransferase domain-containing protein [Clostridia bacterium]|nr:methyltransferase domain-containing protein [Clostridia bacterium]